jgi:hypothetical protein
MRAGRFLFSDGLNGLNRLNGPNPAENNSLFDVTSEKASNQNLILTIELNEADIAYSACGPYSWLFFQFMRSRQSG